MVGGLPVKVTHWGLIVNMSGMIKGEFPPRLREASVRVAAYDLLALEV